MSTEKYQRLVEGLVSKTSRHELDWKTTADTNAFQVSLRQFSIVFSEETMRRSPINAFAAVTSYKVRKFSILNPNGEEIDAFSEDDLSGEIATDLATLYQDVRRQALGVDRALDEILEELTNG
jgi:hypothetical protein